jgi:hypothetical protein
MSFQNQISLNTKGHGDMKDIGNSSFDSRGVHDGSHLLGDVTRL